MSSNTLYILRGVPGSGKTTLANLMTIAFNTVNVHAVAYAADDFFTDENGNYKFDRKRLGESHDWCQDKVLTDMRARIPVIIVHNTFTRRFEIDPYTDMAQESGYITNEIVCKGRWMNEHGVPDEVILNMQNRWED